MKRRKQNIARTVEPRWNLHKTGMLKNIINQIKTTLNDLHYEVWNSWIMSDALEFGLDPDVVDVWLESNYINHYGKTLTKINEESK